MSYEHEEDSNQEWREDEDAVDPIDDADDADDSDDSEPRAEEGESSEIESTPGSDYPDVEGIDLPEHDQTPPVSPTQTQTPSDSTVEGEAGARAILIEVVDQHENRTYIERYPVASIGEPIRRVTPEEANRVNYPDVGDLAKPDFFEIAKVLMDAGVRGNFRNKFLRLKRVGIIFH